MQSAYSIRGLIHQSVARLNWLPSQESGWDGSLLSETVAQNELEYLAKTATEQIFLLP